MRIEKPVHALDQVRKTHFDGFPLELAKYEFNIFGLSLEECDEILYPLPLSA